jgi:hypothetical protein
MSHSPARDTLAAKTAGVLDAVAGAAAGIAADKILSLMPGNLKATNPAAYAALIGAAVTATVSALTKQPEQAEPPMPSPWVLPNREV